jgi:hypothetical protein
VDGKPVIAGVMRLMESQGIPLQVILTHFDITGLVVDWPSFIEEGISLKWRITTIIARVEEAATDVLGKEAAQSIVSGMKIYYLSRYGEELVGP